MIRTKRTKVIRADEEFVTMLEDGRKMMQSAMGQRIPITRYTSELAQIMRPFIALNPQDPRVKRKT